MKRLLLILFTVHCSLLTLLSQAPQGFNYQAVARDTDGSLLASETIDVKIGIRSGNETGPLVWEETHSVITNEFGLFTLKIGDVTATPGSGSAATFSDVDWSAGAHYLAVEIDPGSGFVPMGTSELLSVPFALFAEAGNEGPQGDQGPIGPEGIDCWDLNGNGIDDPAEDVNSDGFWNALDCKGPQGDEASDDQDLNLSGNILTIDNGVNNIDLSGYLDNTDNQSLTLAGNDLSVSGGIGVVDLSGYLDNTDNQDLSLTGDDLSISGGIGSVDLSGYKDNTDSWTQDGDTISYNGLVGIGTESPSGKLEVMGDGTEAADDPLFEVKRKDGQTVFAVYPEGVRIYVEESATKGTKGGFAVGGFNPVKGTTNEYLRVSPDSVRIYINDETGKGTKGGFAVGGYSPLKGLTREFLRVTDDSTRVYVDNDPAKGTKGGFAVGGYSPVKAEATGFMHMTIDNYFIGHESGKSTTTGLFNSFIGYQSGIENTSGRQNIFLGYQSGYDNTSGIFNTFIGYRSGYKNLGGPDPDNDRLGSFNTFVGCNAGYSNTNGLFNAFFGNISGNANTTGSRNTFYGNNSGMRNTIGERNTFIGNASASYNLTGNDNTFLGAYSGLYNTTGYQNVFIGVYAGMGSSDITGDGNTYTGFDSGNKINIGRRNTAIGYQSGFNNQAGDYNLFLGNRAGYSETGSSRLYIANGAVNDSILIYGEFDNKILNFNASIGIGTTSPGKQLEISNTGDAWLRIAADSDNDAGETGNAYLQFITDAENEGFDGLIYLENILGDTKLHFDIEDNLAMTIHNGRLGIGTTSPATSLTNNATLASDGTKTSSEYGINWRISGTGYAVGIENTATGGSGLLVDAGNNSGTGSTVAHFVSANTSLLYIREDGNVGLGTTTPGFTLEVIGTAAKTGGGSWSVSSDLRLKEIHGDYNKGLEEIIKLNPVYFNYKEGNSRNLPDSEEYVGFIAQDVMGVFPEAVNKGTDGYLNFNMHSVNVALVNAVKEQQKMIENQQQEIDILKELVDKLLETGLKNDND